MFSILEGAVGTTLVFLIQGRHRILKKTIENNRNGWKTDGIDETKQKNAKHIL